MADSIAQNLFREYSGSGAADVLRRLPDASPKVFESTWLEFKSGFVKDDDFPRIWSEVIGAFANTGGGVVVWGIGAAHDSETRVDAASNLQLVSDVNAFTTKLRKAAQSNVDPPLKGLEIVPILAEEGASKGFVVCYIPEGDNKPYESLKAEKRFYMRFDDRCEKIGLPALRLLFNPSVETRARLTVKHGEWSTMRQRFLTLQFTLENIGLNSIEGGCLKVEAERSAIFKRGPVSDVVGAPKFHMLEPMLLHPGMTSHFEILVQQERTFSLEMFIVRFFQRNHRVRTAHFAYDYAHKDFYGGDNVLPNPISLTLEDGHR